MSEVKVIRRYKNRKLYDTTQGQYVNLEDIGKMVRSQEEVQVIDYETGSDITAFVLTQVIFDAERELQYATPVSALREIIQRGSLTVA